MIMFGTTNFLFVSGLLISFTGLIIASILLGAFAYGRKNSTQILGVLLALSMSSWGAGATWLGTNLTAEDAVIAGRVMHIGIIFIPAFFVHFVITITENKKNWAKYVVYIHYILAIFLLGIDIGTPYFVREVRYLFNEFYYNTNPTMYYIIFIISYGASTMLGLYLLYKKQKEDGGDSYRALLWGLGISWFGGSTVLLPVLGIMVYPYGNLLIPIYPIAIAYTILKHRLFDARYAILQVMRVLSVSIFGLSIAFILYKMSVRFLEYTPQFNPIEASIWIIAIGVIVTLYKSQRISGMFLISSLAALEKEAESFLKKKGVYKNQEKLLTDLEGLFYRGSKIRQVDILSDASVLDYPQIIKYFEKYRKPLVLTELETEEVEGENILLIKEVRGLGEAIFPIENIGGKGFYFLILGKKESEEQITEKEIKIINRILPKVALALQVLDYHKSLQEEVKNQTKILNIKNKQLSEANSKLQEIDKNKDNFLAIASHELRTPMTIIRGYSDLFLKETFGSMGETARTYMQRIYNSSEGLIELVNNILDISKIEAGRFEINKAPMNISETLEKCIENFSTLYEQKGIALGLTNNCDKNKILTDESKFVLICTNLLSNAYKFTETGGTVSVKAWEEGSSMLAVRIEDTGKGIEENRIGHIFEKFNQTDNTSYKNKSIHGSGLGLYLCHLIIQLLGGKIEADSHFGKGSIFTFFIPFTDDSHTS